jgi:hypothetical protein
MFLSYSYNRRIQYGPLYSRVLVSIITIFSVFWVRLTHVPNSLHCSTHSRNVNCSVYSRCNVMTARWTDIPDPFLGNG